MENTVDQIGEFKVFNSPEELSASLNAEPQVETQAAPEPQVEQSEAATPEPVSEPQVEPLVAEPTESQPVEDQTVTETPQENYQQESSLDSSDSEEYSQDQIDEAISTYLSEKLGREISSLDDFANVASPIDERVEAISKFVTETGRSPQEWFTYQSLNTSEMDDMTVLKVDMAIQYPTLSSEEVTTLIQNKYNLDPSASSE